MLRKGRWWIWDRHKQHEEKYRGFQWAIVETVLDVATIFEKTSFTSVVYSIQKYSREYYSTEQIKKFFPHLRQCNDFQTGARI